MSDKGTKVYGGLIRKEKRVETDRHGNTTTQHWDGRKDVRINAPTATVVASTPRPTGGE